jgi:hypothetical protein
VRFIRQKSAEFLFRKFFSGLHAKLSCGRCILLAAAAQRPMHNLSSHNGHVQHLHAIIHRIIRRRTLSCTDCLSQGANMTVLAVTSPSIMLFPLS